MLVKFSVSQVGSCARTSGKPFKISQGKDV